MPAKDPSRVPSGKGVDVGNPPGSNATPVKDPTVVSKDGRNPDPTDVGGDGESTVNKQEISRIKDVISI